jgi:hypothetical protein
LTTGAKAVAFASLFALKKFWRPTEKDTPRWLILNYAPPAIGATSTARTWLSWCGSWMKPRRAGQKPGFWRSAGKVALTAGAFQVPTVFLSQEKPGFFLIEFKEDKWLLN